MVSVKFAQLIGINQIWRVSDCTVKGVPVLREKTARTQDVLALVSVVHFLKIL